MEKGSITQNRIRLYHFFDKNISLREVVFIALVILCLSSYLSPSLALLLGFLVAQFVGHPYLHLNHKVTHILLQASVVGLGFGMDVTGAMEAGKQGALFAMVSIVSVFMLGFVISKLFKIEKKTAFLISAGTAICGGSAIAAVSPVIKAEEKQISVALGVVFILNAVALFVFPAIGQALAMSQEKFGLWSAIAIHDTSSVIGAAANYGTKALEIATTVKLARALWIIPVALVSSVIFKAGGGKIKIPYFIGLFIVAMVVSTYVPPVKEYAPYITKVSKSGLTLTLFLIGSGLSVNRIRSVGVKPLLLGLVLWVLISVFSLCSVIFLV